MVGRVASIAGSGIRPGNRSPQQSGEAFVLGCEVGSQAMEHLGRRGFAVATIGDRRCGIGWIRRDPEPVEHPVAGAFRVPEVVFGEEDEHPFGPEGLEPPFELLGVSAAGEVREVLMKSRNGIGLVEKALRLAGEPCRFLFDRILEVERLDAEPSFMSMMRPGPQGGIPEQYHEIEIRAQQIARDPRSSRMEEVVGARVAGSKTAAEPAAETGAAEDGLLQTSTARLRRAGAGENPAFLGRPRKNVWRSRDPTVEVGRAGLLGADQEEIRKDPPWCR